MRVLPHNLSVLACSRLALVGVDDQVSRLGVLVPALGVHETPLHTGWETSATASSESRCLDLRDEPLVPLLYDFLGLVPVAVLHRALQVGAVVAVEVGEDAVLIPQTAVTVDRWRILDSGHTALLLAILGSGLVGGGGGEGADGVLGEVRRGRLGAQCGLCRCRQHLERVCRQQGE